MFSLSYFCICCFSQRIAGNVKKTLHNCAILIDLKEEDAKNTTKIKDGHKCEKEERKAIKHTIDKEMQTFKIYKKRNLF